ncbi:MAG: serine hydrolase [Hyphomonadaceae bacterium]|nr:serine hydrolase [Hyphomonadaceae bacterium]
MNLRRFTLAAVLLFVVALAPTNALAREPVAPGALDGVAAELDAARAAFDAPGLAVAIVAGGKVVMAEGFGQRGLEDAARVDADTRFALGSCTKAFTSFGVGLLAEEGKLRFSDRVAAHDPVLQLPLTGALDTLTIANLLSQRSGLARHDFLWHALPGMTRAEFAAAQGELAMQRAPGTQFGYTNSAFILAGRVIELRAGEDWETFTAQRIFAPLAMTRSNFSSAGLAADDNAARATKRADGISRTVAWRDGRLLGPAGSINSTAHDMTRWLLVLTGGGAINGERVIAMATLDTLWTPVAGPEKRLRGRGGEDGGGYAMGWRIDTWRGQRRISHSGAVDGFRARVTLFPDRGVGIVTMVNVAPSQLPDFATRVLAERLLGLPRETDLAVLAAARRAEEIRAAGAGPPVPRGRLARLMAKDDAVAPSQPLAAFHGVYHHPAYGDVRIEPSADASSLRIAFGALKGRLDHWRADSFIAFSDRPDDTLDEGEIVFAADTAGSVSGFTAMIDNDIAPIPFVRSGALPIAVMAPASAQLTISQQRVPSHRSFRWALWLLAPGVGGLAWVGLRRARPRSAQQQGAATSWKCEP